VYFFIFVSLFYYLWSKKREVHRLPKGYKSLSFSPVMFYSDERDKKTQSLSINIERKRQKGLEEQSSRPGREQTYKYTSLVFLPSSVSTKIRFFKKKGERKGEKFRFLSTPL
jgi:hypothetical protein